MRRRIPLSPTVEEPNPLRIRMNRFIPDIDLSAARPDEEDPRMLLMRLGSVARS